MSVNAGYGHTVGTLQGLSLIPVAIGRCNFVLRTVHAVPKTVHAVPKTVHAVPKTVHAVPRTVHDVPKTVCAVPKTVRAVPKTVRAVLKTVHGVLKTVHAVQAPTKLPRLISPAHKHATAAAATAICSQRWLRILSDGSCAWQCCACTQALQIISVRWCKSALIDLCYQ